MRRFVTLDRDGSKVGEGVEASPGGPAYMFLTGHHGGRIQSFTDMDEVADFLASGQQLRFLDYHTADEAYKLAAE